MAGSAFAVTLFTPVASVEVAVAEDKPPLPEGAIRISEVKRGQSVVLHGTVDRIPDEDEIILKDESGKIEIDLGKLGRMPVKVGDTVTVYGRADDDVLPGFRPDIYASKLVLADGSEIPVEQWD